MSSKVFKDILSFILIAFIIAVCYFISWAVITGTIWLVFKALHLSYSLKYATAFWLILVIWKLIPRKKGDSNANV